MPLTQFRAWNGRSIVHEFAVNAQGIALRLEYSIDGRQIHCVLEPSWIVSMASGFVDRDGTRIFEDDVVELGGKDDAKTLAAIAFIGGRFIVLPTNQLPERELIPLANYCNPTFNYMIRVVGTLYEQNLRSAFGAFAGIRKPDVRNVP